MTTPDSPSPAGPLAAMPPVSAGRIRPDGRRVYRLAPPLILWWAWVLLAVAGLADLLIQGHHRIPLTYAAGTLAITGLMFACTLWPVVAADDDGVTVRNPFRSFRIPWGAVRGVFMAESVEFRCARPAPKAEKTVYSWALHSSRRSRARSELRASLRARGRMSQPAGYARLPGEARNMLRQLPAEVMARELAKIAEQAREQGRPAGVLSAWWAWQPLTAVAVPAAALAALLIR